MKLDYRKKWAHLYGTKREPVIVDVPALSYLMVDGRGDPEQLTRVSGGGGSLVQPRVLPSSSPSGAVKARDFSVMPLEGQWWCEDMRKFSVDDKSNWLWTLMIPQPPELTGALVRKCREELAKKKDLPALGKLRYEKFKEGTLRADPAYRSLHR